MKTTKKQRAIWTWHYRYSSHHVDAAITNLCDDIDELEEKLIEERSGFIRQIQLRDTEIETLEEKLKIAVDALEFYQFADSSSIDLDFYNVSATGEYLWTGAKRARKALSDIAAVGSEKPGDEG